jgi:hypothetical protein
VVAVFTGALVLPALLAALGGWRGLRWVRWLGVALMVLMGGALLVRFANELRGHIEPEPLTAAVPAALLLSGAWLLRHPWKDETP